MSVASSSGTAAEPTTVPTTEERLIENSSSLVKRNGNKEGPSQKAVTMAIVIAVAMIGLTMISMHGRNTAAANESSFLEAILPGHEYDAKMKVNMKVKGELAAVLKKTQDLTEENKARLDVLNGLIDGDDGDCDAKITLLSNKVTVLKNDVDVWVGSPEAAQSSLPYMMRGWKLAQPTQCTKNQLVGTFDFAGNNRYIVDMEFLFVARPPGGKHSTIFAVGDYDNRLPSVHLKPDKNELLIHQKTVANKFGIYNLTPHTLVSGKTYKLRVESQGYAMTARLTGPGLDSRFAGTAPALWVSMPAGEQKIWISDPWHDVPNVKVIRASIMTIF